MLRKDMERTYNPIDLRLRAYSGESDQGSGVKPISVPVDSDQVIGA
jgi:hypothetical protein